MDNEIESENESDFLTEQESIEYSFLYECEKTPVFDKYGYNGYVMNLEGKTILSTVSGTTEWFEHTYDKFGFIVKFIHSSGDWYEYTRNESGIILEYKDSTGFWIEYTRDEQGRTIFFKDSLGNWFEKQYSNDEVISYRNSKGEHYENVQRIR